jgi:hypothetical protein
MTVAELREALSEYPDDAIVDVYVDTGTWTSGDRDIAGISDVITVHRGPNKGTWVTLGLE